MKQVPVAGCVRLGRIFVSRLLNWLRSAFHSDTVGNKQKIYRYIPTEIKKDLKWWYELLPVFNGVSMMAVEEWSYPDTVFSCDACLEGLGGMFEDKFFHAIFPPFITEQNLHIRCITTKHGYQSKRTYGKVVRKQKMNSYIVG
jgi:hypothetical protein